MVELRGMTWDHPRGVEPLKATTEQFQRENPNIRIHWDARSLKDFEAYPIEVLAEKYDLIMMDHPFIGQGVAKKVLLPLDEWLPKEFLNEQERNSVGPSYKSYTWNGHQWALAADAAAQVSAYRRDLFQSFHLQVPKKWNEVFELINALPEGLKIGLPLNPTHAFASFLTLCANLTGFDFWNEVSGIEQTAGEEALSLLQKLASIVHQSSLSMNPIQMLDLMSSTDELVYSPLIYGYVNYSLDHFAKHIIHFTDMPSVSSEPSGSVVGGVGIMVSAHSSYKQEAVNYVKYVVSEECQRGLYFNSGGQPGHRQAWLDPEINRKAHGFFENTLKTLDNAYTRPRFNGYTFFQEQGGEIVHQSLIKGTQPSEVIQDLNQAYRKLRVDME